LSLSILCLKEPDSDRYMRMNLVGWQVWNKSVYRRKIRGWVVAGCVSSCGLLHCKEHKNLFTHPGLNSLPGGRIFCCLPQYI
jgi:hypothetical protein